MCKGNGEVLQFLVDVRFFAVGKPSLEGRFMCLIRNKNKSGDAWQPSDLVSEVYLSVINVVLPEPTSHVHASALQFMIMDPYFVYFGAIRIPGNGYVQVNALCQFNVLLYMCFIY